MIITLLTGKTSKIKERIKLLTGLDLKVTVSTRSKKMNLKIDSKNKTPSLSIPKFCSEKKAIDFVVKNLTWINEKMEGLVSGKKFTDGDNLSLFGQELILKHSPKARSGVHLEGDFLVVSGEAAFIHRRTMDFIKKMARIKFYDLSKIKAEEVDCQVNNVVIKDTKTRWGSCSSKGNLNYNWRIALAPYFVFEYLVCHEVAHLKHQDHSEDFWKTVAKLTPYHQQGKAWLKQHGKTLYLYE
ncbi:MAG: SprT family zinc-dependent metalloprotease [Alphaproteobacteria bacterium]|nr:SprT family zinc-dependent metalloprotease [Alphaproteobacteria bacterium]